MHYFYGNATVGWNSRRKHKLVKGLNGLIADFIANEPGANVKNPPYVEDGNTKTRAVLMRRLTNLPEHLIEKLTSLADQLYKEVMGAQ
jgi:hypothetical protein